MGEQQRSGEHELSRRRLLKTLGWAGAVFAISFGVPVKAHADPTCSLSEPDADCGAGSGPTYDHDEHCRAEPNGSAQSDLGCSHDTGGGSIDTDANCAVAHGDLGVDIDNDCGHSADNSYWEPDTNCGEGTGDPPSTDNDQRCNHTNGAGSGNTHADHSCAVRHQGEPYGTGDLNCGWQTAPGWIDGDGNCGTQNRANGTADEDGDCGQQADPGGAFHEDSSCGKLVGTDSHLDLDGDCHKPSFPAGTFFPDASCGKFTNGGGTLPPRDEDENCGFPTAQGPDVDGMTLPPTPPDPANPPPAPKN